MAKYKLKNTNILHNGDLVKVGSVIELTDMEAKRLADILIPIKESTNKDKTPATKTETKTKTKTKEDETKKDESADGGNE